MNLCVLVVFRVAVIKSSDKSKIWEADFIWVQSSEAQSLEEVLGAGVWGRWSHGMSSQDGENSKCEHSVHILLLMESRNPAEEMRTIHGIPTPTQLIESLIGKLRLSSKRILELTS